MVKNKGKNGKVLKEEVFVIDLFYIFVYNIIFMISSQLMQSSITSEFFLKIDFFKVVMIEAFIMVFDLLFYFCLQIVQTLK